MVVSLTSGEVGGSEIKLPLTGGRKSFSKQPVQQEPS